MLNHDVNNKCRYWYALVQIQVPWTALAVIAAPSAYLSQAFGVAFCCIRLHLSLLLNNTALIFKLHLVITPIAICVTIH